MRPSLTACQYTVTAVPDECLAPGGGVRRRFWWRAAIIDWRAFPRSGFASAAGNIDGALSSVGDIGINAANYRYAQRLTWKCFGGS